MKELPSKLKKDLLRFEALYVITQKDLEALLLQFSDDDIAKLLADSNDLIDRLDVETAARVRQTAARVAEFEYRLAERLLRVPPIEVTPAMRRSIERRFYLTFYQQHQDIRRNLTEVIETGFKRGMSLVDRRAFQKVVIDQGITGLVRKDGSRLSVEKTGKVLVRTRVNQLQAESQLERYAQADVDEVEFVAGGACTFKGEGGTCTGLNGRRFPINDVPEWARIPRHAFSNSRYLPVIPN